jgi:hypothetical protein
LEDVDIESWFSKIEKSSGDDTSWWRVTRSFLQKEKEDGNANVHSMIYFDTTEGRNYLHPKFHAPLLFQYQQGWDSQINAAYSAVASAAALLNSLRGSLLPETFPYITQRDILENDCVRQKVTHTQDSELIYLVAGLGMEHTTILLGCLLEGQNYDIQIHRIQPILERNESPYRKMLNIKQFSQVLLQGVAEGSRVFINYDRSVLGQEGHGHWSPVVAYNNKLKSWLVLDTAKYQYPPVWVPTQKLFDATSILDICGSFSYSGKRNIEWSPVDLARSLQCSQT